MITRLATSLVLAAATVSAAPDPLNSYNVVWESQSKGSADSMPLSGGVLGLNVWAQDGDICFLIGSPNCMDENGMQVKLGLIKLHFEPAIFDAGFKQELRLAQSEIILTGKTASGAPVAVKLWSSVEHPVVHVETTTGEAVEVTATYETWTGYDAKVANGKLQWSRRLAEVNARRQNDMKAQGMAEFAKQIPDPLSGLTCGGRIDGPGMVAAGVGTGTFNGMPTRTTSLRTADPVRQLDLCITLRMEQDKSLAAWEAQLNQDARCASENAKDDRAAALAWWNQFWDRSHIFINPGKANLKSEISKSPAGEAWRAGRNYQLIRYMYASNIKGKAMTLFNGGSFPCTGNPDVREWDGCQFMAQNQRLSYWPLLRSGDFDILKVATDFYRDRTEMSRSHARKFWGVDGVAWCEGFSIFGLGSMGTTADGRCNPRHLERHYTSGMEFALMMLEMERYTGKDFPHYRDAALGIIRYYDQYHQTALTQKIGKPLDDKGRLVIYPSDACEPYHGCTNNTDVIAGLTALTRELLALPSGKLSGEERTYLQGFQKRIPSFPMQEKDGKKFFAAADSWEWVMQNQNMDFPQMYICFPFNILSLGRSDMSLAKNTFDLSPINAKVQHQNHAWYQTVINFARMGETTRAKPYILEKMNHNSARFPTFYKTSYINGRPNFNHMPDHDHSGTAMSGLQEMLMQCDGRRILLGAAWPAEWDGSFKLHAPYQTTVEGHIADGKVVVDRVSPASRRKDIEVFPLKVAPPTPVSEDKPATASSTHGPSYTADKAFDGDTATRWSTAAGHAEAWLEVDLGAEMVIKRAIIDESSYPQTLKFVIESLQADGSWMPVVAGGAIGPNRELKFPPAKARKFRLHVLESKLINSLSGVNINEFQLFLK